MRSSRKRGSLCLRGTEILDILLWVKYNVYEIQTLIRKILDVIDIIDVTTVDCRVLLRKLIYYYSSLGVSGPLDGLEPGSFGDLVISITSVEFRCEGLIYFLMNQFFNSSKLLRVLLYNCINLL